ncbi:MAG: ATP-NAD kinase family protein [Bacillota bacterium]
MKKLGLIINPIAGMGGRVGLKGTDGAEILKRARLLGAAPQSSLRAGRALSSLESLKGRLQLITGQTVMGENVAKELGFEVLPVKAVLGPETSAEDTIAAAREMLALKVDLLLFAGGDGTARDICSAVGTRLPCLGIPTGVKMHSAVFATDPGRAGQLALLFLTGKATRLQPAEVMDLDEEAFRQGRVSAGLYGYLNIPYVQNYTQNIKAGSGSDERAVLKEIAFEVISKMEQDRIYIIGPGTTTMAITDQLGFSGTLLGVDIVLNQDLIAKDVNEQQLLAAIKGRPAAIIVTVIGGQGYLFGRGNQQISHRVIAQVGRENIIVVVTKQKVFSLKGSPFLVDTGSEEVNQALAGYLPAITGRNQSLMCKVIG